MKRPVYDEAWSDDVKTVYRHDVREMWNETVQPHIWRQYHNQLEIYERIVDVHGKGRRLRVLDVGCAQATLALLLAEAGHKLVAIDLRKEFLDYAAHRYSHGDIRFVRANIFEFETDERFDLIFANQIIEHVVYPSQMLTKLYGVLASDGMLVVTTPNWDYAVSRFPSFRQLGNVERYAELQFTADADGHFFAYKEEELVELFQDAGFSHVVPRHFESPFVSGHMKMRYAQRFAPVPLLRLLDRWALSIPGLGRRLAHQLMVTGARP